jgi:WD40 repeat protein
MKLRLSILAALAALAALAILATAASLVAVDQREQATRGARIAEARRVGAQALAEPAPDRALLLAVEGVHLWNSPETRANLLTTIQRNPQAAAVIRVAGPGLRDLDISPDGKWAAGTDDNGSLTLFDLTKRAPIAHLGGTGTDTLYAGPQFSPDGAHLAVYPRRATCGMPCPDHGYLGITLLNARDLSPVGITYRERGAPGMAYSPRGGLIATATPTDPPATTITVWRINRLDKPIVRLDTSKLGLDLLGWIGFSPDGSRLYASDDRGPTVELDAATGRLLRRFGGVGLPLALSPDGATIALATGGPNVRLVDTATGKQRAQLTGAADATGAAFSRDGALLATIRGAHTAEVWDVATGQRLHQLGGHVGRVLAVAFGVLRHRLGPRAWRAVGHQLYTSGSDGSVIRWDLDPAGGLIRQLVPPRHRAAPLLSPSADSALFPSTPDDNASLLNLDTGALTPLPSSQGTAWEAYRPDGRQIAAIGGQQVVADDLGDYRWDGWVRLWDVQTAKMIAERPGRDDDLSAIAFTPDGTRIVVADLYRRVTELDARTLRPTGRSLNLGLDPTMPPNSISIQTSHAGVIAFTTSIENEGTSVVFADLDDGQILHRIRLPSGGLTAANFSPDGRLYAYGGDDGRVGIIDVATGSRIEGSRDPIHNRPVTWVTFSPDSSTLASLGADGQVTLLETTRAVPLARLQLDKAKPPASAGYLADGHTLVIADEDGSVISFDTDPIAWEKYACAVAGRNLTNDEWHDVFGDRTYRQTCPEP